MRDPENYSADCYTEEAASDNDQTALGHTEVTLAMARTLADRVEGLADRLLGSVPMPVPPVPPVPPAPTSGTVFAGSTTGALSVGLLPGLRNGSEKTRRYVADANKALDRIERSLP